ncbi:MAG: GNAT family N-acetyltransferase [Acidimicrobiia bacterium]
MTEPDPDFVARHTTDIELRDGTRVRIRPITPDDRDRLKEGFERLSPRSRYLRFLAPVAELTPEMLDYLTEVDYHDHFAWGALALDQEGHPGIGVARYVRLHDEPEVAEPAVAVADEYQGRGLGTALLYTLSDTAVQHGIKRFRALVLAENEAMLQVFREMGASLRRTGGTMIEVEIELPPAPGGLHEENLRSALRAVAKGEVEVPSPVRRWLAR